MEVILVYLAMAVAIGFVTLKEDGYFKGKEGYICEECDLFIMMDYSDQPVLCYCNKPMTKIKGYL